MADGHIQLTNEHIAKFNADGFLVVENLVGKDLVDQMVSRVDPLFSGQFETGVYPDEWYWRPGLSLPDVTRQMCNVWKSDLLFASVVLSAEIGRLVALLSGWPGARIGQDSLWMKPPGAKAVSLHQDSTYISYIDPPEMTTCWIALEDTSADIGTIEYARGSHTWPLKTAMGEFHAPQGDHRDAMRQAAAELGVPEPEIVPIEIPAGSCVIHHGNVWHGSAKNLRSDRPRLSVSVHTLSSAATFQSERAGYIYGRYKRMGDPTMDENFFPILWTRESYRTPFLDHYCRDAIRERQLLLIN